MVHQIWLLLGLTICAQLSLAGQYARGIMGHVVEDPAALEAELLDVGRRIFDRQRLDQLSSEGFGGITDLEISGLCKTHSIQYVTGILDILAGRGKHDQTKTKNQPVILWPLQMFDAMGKIPTGLLEINQKWIGSFTECLNIKSANLEFSGQYCTISFQNEVPGNCTSYLGCFLVQTGTTLGICWPSSCNETEVEKLINRIHLLPDLPVYKAVKPGYCQVDYVATLDAATISIIALYVAFIVLVLVATVYDPIRRRRAKYQKLEAVEDEGTPADSKESKQGVCHRILLCFSIYSNGKNISVAEDPGERALGCIHGIRVFSLLWAILMRTCDYATIMAIKDFKDVIASTQEWSFDIILNATFCMDSMLFASGFCVAYSLLSKMKISGGRVKDFARYYIHGFLRVTPLLAMSVAFLAGPFYLIASGPQWPDMKMVQTACQNDWWKTLLYINNLFDTQNFCVTISWYTSLEMQFYVVAPLILYPLYRWPIVGYIIGGMFCLLTTLTPALLIHYKDLAGFPDTEVMFFPTVDYSRAYNIDIYVKPWCRMGPYLVGMALAYYLFRKDKKVKMHSIVLLIGWMMAVALALALVYGNLYYFALKLTMSNPLRSVYGALSRPAWALCIAWIVLVCSTGNGGYSNHFLSWRMFLSVSKLSYSINIVHLYVMLSLFESYEGTMYFQTYLLGLLYVGITFASIGISSIFYFLFEAPVVQLEKTFLPEHGISPNSRKSSICYPT